MEDQPVQTPMEDLVNDALDHYEEAASSISHWNSLIPRALRFYLEYHENKVDKITFVRNILDDLNDDMESMLRHAEHEAVERNYEKATSLSQQIMGVQRAVDKIREHISK